MAANPVLTDSDVFHTGGVARSEFAAGGTASARGKTTGAWCGRQSYGWSQWRTGLG